jgi:hypothetical protein
VIARTGEPTRSLRGGAITRSRVAIIRRIAAGLVIASAVVPLAPARAGCVHTASLWSCSDANGTAVELFCVGAGVVLTCMDFAGKWVLVSPHEVLSQITSVDNQLSSALAADAAHRAQSADTTTQPSLGTGQNAGRAFGITPNQMPPHP